MIQEIMRLPSGAKRLVRRLAVRNCAGRACRSIRSIRGWRAVSYIHTYICIYIYIYIYMYVCIYIYVCTCGGIRRPGGKSRKARRWKPIPVSAKKTLLRIRLRTGIEVCRAPNQGLESSFIYIYIYIYVCTCSGIQRPGGKKVQSSGELRDVFEDAGFEITVC